MDVTPSPAVCCVIRRTTSLSEFPFPHLLNANAKDGSQVTAKHLQALSRHAINGGSSVTRYRKECRRVRGQEAVNVMWLVNRRAGSGSLQRAGCCSKAVQLRPPAAPPPVFASPEPVRGVTMPFLCPQRFLTLHLARRGRCEINGSIRKRLEETHRTESGD